MHYAFFKSYYFSKLKNLQNYRVGIPYILSYFEVKIQVLSLVMINTHVHYPRILRAIFAAKIRLFKKCSFLRRAEYVNNHT